MTAVARSAPVDLLAHGRLHPLIPAICECSGFEQPVPVDRDRIVLRNTMQVGPAAFSVALKVTPQTQRVHLDKGRAQARTRAMASPAATWTASTELPSTRTPGIPYGAARR